MEKANLKNGGWLKKFLHWISEGSVKSVSASGFCSTWKVKLRADHREVVKKATSKKGRWEICPEEIEQGRRAKVRWREEAAENATRMIAHLRHENGAARVRAARPTETGAKDQAGVPDGVKEKAEVGSLDKSKS